MIIIRNEEKGDTRWAKQSKTGINLLMFLDGLTELSRKHRIGLTGQPTLFVMEDDDFERA